MRKIIVLVVLTATLGSQAQKLSDAKRFAGQITEEGLRKHLAIVASKDFEGRETATEGQRKAAAYIQEQFTALGLAPGAGDGYQLYYPVYRDSLISASVSVNGQAFRLMDDFDVNIAANHVETLMASEVVFAGNGITDSAQDDYQGLDVRGKIVMILNDMPAGRLQGQINRRSFNPYGRQDAAQQHGAAGLLIIQNDFPRARFNSLGNMYLSGYKRVNRPNSWYISEKVARAILGNAYDSLKNGSLHAKSCSVDLMVQFDKSTTDLRSSDVLGYLEGSDLKDETLVISAHYDHLGKRDTVIYYGADDDGSGTVSILEIAQAFAAAKTAGKGPRRSILFLANSGEEKGLWGSAYYTDHPVFSLEKTTADLNIDMIGRIDPNRKNGDSTNYVYVVGDDKLSSDLKPISESVNKKTLRLELDYKFNDPKDPQRIYYRSDHYNFARKGVPIIFYFDGIHKDYHRPTDTPDKINYDLLQRRAQLVFYTAWEMANRDQMMKRDIPLSTQ